MSMRKTIVAAAIAAVAVLGAAGTASASDSDSGGNSAEAVGHASDSPGLLSGNVIQIPVDIPINVCGNDVSILSALTSALGNSCANG